MNPKYPVYIISKGRWETRKTSKALEFLKVPYYIVIEPQEFNQYATVIAPNKILQLPFSNLGQGSIPARNWVWEHSTAAGHERHWIIDDNIEGFYRLNNNLKTPVGDGTIFRCCEDFTDRYENVPMSGMNYFMFASRKSKNPPFYLNTRIYSCILLSNKTDLRWRGRYNEDTDLSIRFLKAGFCTILFNAFLCGKSQTMTMKGGNTESLYNIKEGEKDGRLLMAESLVEQHPDIVTVSEKWGRYQHHVDYRAFEFNKLIKKPGLIIPDRVNNYGMKLIKVNIPQDQKKEVVVPDNIEEEPEVDNSPEIIKEIIEPYAGEYVVTFAYEIKEKDIWELGGRFTGTKQECEIFIKEWQAQTALF